MAGGAGFGGGDEEMISGINVTPLVDVVLVLLVIFLMTAPVLYQKAIKVDLPKAKTGEETKASPFSFSVNPAGEYFYGKDKVTLDEIAQQVQALAAGGKNMAEETAVISADQATPHGNVVKLMDTLRAAGLVRFGLNVEMPAAGAAK